MILQKTNPNRHLTLIDGIGNYFNENIPGGFKGWLKELENSKPSVIVLDYVPEQFKNELMEYLQISYQRADVWRWSLYLRKEHVLMK